MTAVLEHSVCPTVSQQFVKHSTWNALILVSGHRFASHSSLSRKSRRGSECCESLHHLQQKHAIQAAHRTESRPNKSAFRKISCFGLKYKDCCSFKASKTTNNSCWNASVSHSFWLWWQTRTMCVCEQELIALCDSFTFCCETGQSGRTPL